MGKWISLEDRTTAARLKVATTAGGQHLFITGLSSASPRWHQAVKRLAFAPDSNGLRLIRKVKPGERITSEQFHGVWPFAVVKEMDPSEYILDLTPGKRREEHEQRAREEQAIALSSNNARRLGRNADGDEVFASDLGRFVWRPGTGAAYENATTSPAAVLRAPTPQDLDKCADGFVASMVKGEVLHSEDFDRFIAAVSEDAPAPAPANSAPAPADEGSPASVRGAPSVELRSEMHAVIDAAVVRYLNQEFDTAQDAYGMSVQLYELLPPFSGRPRGAGTMPIALSVMAQRLLGDTAGQRVVVPHAFDGASFAFLANGTRVLAYKAGRDLSRAAQALTQRLEGRGTQVQWDTEFSPARESGASAMFFNADPVRGDDGQRLDFREALVAVRSMDAGGRAVLVLACEPDDLPGEPGEASQRFLRSLLTRYDVQSVFEVGAHLQQRAGTKARLRVIALRNAPPLSTQERQELQAAAGNIRSAEGAAGSGLELSDVARATAVDASRLNRLATANSWDEVKSMVDETIAYARLSQAQSSSVNIARATEVNRLQSPYLPFSKIGESRAMVPRNMQAAVQGALADVEATYGPVDDFVCRELGWGPQTLAQRLGPEQVDGSALIFSRLRRGLGFILSDETGFGKGRQLAVAATWAARQGWPVVFVTDRANLFSDLVRDMRDVGEFGRFQPLITNSDGHVVEMVAPVAAARQETDQVAGAADAQQAAAPVVSAGMGSVLVQATPSDEMSEILRANRDMASLGVNMVMTTYSQFAGAESPKAVWLKNQLPNALLILDESHIAAGSDSSIARHICEMVAMAKGVVYSSATWAKTPKNLQIYSRALPRSVNIASLVATIARNGAGFSEVLSSMLARDGALMRREHDLSRLEFVLEVDPATVARNRKIADQVSEIMGKMTLVSGELDRMMVQISRASVDALKAARAVLQQARVAARAQGAGGAGVGAANSASIFSTAFGAGSMLYQVQRRMNAALNISNAVRLAMRGVEEGMKPVIVFDDTAESYVRRAMQKRMIHDERGRPTGADVIDEPTLRDALVKVLEDLSTVKVSEVTYEEVMAAQAAGRDLITDERLDDQARDMAQLEQAAAAGVVDVPEQAPPDEAADQDEPAPIEQGIDVGEAAGAAAQPRTPGEGGEDEEGAQTPVRRARRAPLRRIPFDMLPGLTEQQRQTFRDGIQTITQSIAALPDLPLSVADALHEALRRQGLRTGEISGRSFTLEPVEHAAGTQGPGEAGESGRRQMFVRRRLKSKAMVNQSVAAFNNGDLDAMILNRSGATGLSLHASPRFADQKRRMLIELQPPENPNERVQLFGRVNRYDQVSFPYIAIASTGVPGETRHSMMQNAKLRDMSANVRSSRETHAIVGDVVDLLNPVGRAVCKQFLLDNPLYATHMALPLHLIESDGFDAASAFTRNISLLPVAQQEVLYDQVNQLYADEVIRRELAGEDDLTSKDFDWRARTVNQEVVMGLDHGGLGSAFDGPVHARELVYEVELNPPKWQALTAGIAARRQQMIEAGLMAQTGTLLDEHRTPIGDFEPMAAKVNAMVTGLARLSVRATTFATVEEAMAAPTDNQVKRAMARAQWLQENLRNIYPGARIDLRDESVKKGEWGAMRPAIVVDVIAPKPGREGLTSQWRVMVLRPGAQSPQPYSLSALMRDSERQGDRVINKGVEVGRDQMLYGKNSGSEYVVRAYMQAPRGLRTRRAAVLAGNMVLATEFATQARVGKSITYSDDRGVRHRAILLDKRFSPESLRYMPVRVWVRSAVERMVQELSGAAPYQAYTDAEGKPRCGAPTLSVEEDGDAGGFDVHTSFHGAWGAVVGARLKTDDQLSIKPGVGLVLRMSADSLKRMQQSLAGVQRRIRDEIAVANHKLALQSQAATAAAGAPDQATAAGAPDDGPGHPDHDVARAQDEGDEADEALGNHTQDTQDGHEPHEPAAGAGRRGRAGRPTLLASQDPDHVVVSAQGGRSRRGAAAARAAGAGQAADVDTSAGVLTLKATTPGQVLRAVRMLWDGPGLQLYVRPFGKLGQMARRIVREDLVQRAREDLSVDPQRLAKLEEQLARLEEDEAQQHMARQRRFMRLVQDQTEEGPGTAQTMGVQAAALVAAEDAGPAAEDGAAGQTQATLDLQQELTDRDVVADGRHDAQGANDAGQADAEEQEQPVRARMRP